VDRSQFVRTSLGIAAALALGASTLIAGAMPAVAHGGTQHPVTINKGACELLDEVAIPLGDAGDQLPIDGEPAASDPMGAESAIQVDGSQTNVQMSLTDLLGGYAITVHASADEMETIVACGDIGGRMMGQSELPVGIAEVDGSGTNGIAILEDNGDGTTEVSVYVIKAESTNDHSHDDDHDAGDDHDHDATPGA
jgi:hypothetical protein